MLRSPVCGAPVIQRQRRAGQKSGEWGLQRFSSLWHRQRFVVGNGSSRLSKDCLDLAIHLVACAADAPPEQSGFQTAKAGGARVEPHEISAFSGLWDPASAFGRIPEGPGQRSRRHHHDTRARGRDQGLLLPWLGAARFPSSGTVQAFCSAGPCHNDVPLRHPSPARGCAPPSPEQTRS